MVAAVMGHQQWQKGSWTLADLDKNTKICQNVYDGLLTFYQALLQLSGGLILSRLDIKLRSLSQSAVTLQQCLQEGIYF